MPIEPAIQLAINEAIRASEKEATAAREKLSRATVQDLTKEFSPISATLVEQTKTIGDLRDESLRTKVEVELISAQLARLLARLLEQQSTPQEPAEKKEMILRSMDNRTKVTLAIIALIPAALASIASALASYLATK